MLTGEAASLPAALDLLERAIGYARGSLALVGPPLRHRATPCAGWDVDALLHHMDDSLLALLEATEVGYVDLSPPTARQPPDPLPTRSWTGSARGRARCSSLAPVRSRSRSTGGTSRWRSAARHPIPEALARELVDLAPLLVTESDRPARFAPAVPVPAGAAAGDRLVALTGRRP